MENQECLVSIMCMAYNHEKYIRQTLQCFVDRQTDFAFEVLVNDDCSTDGTAAIIREFEEKYPNIIRAFYQPKNLFSQGIYVEPTVFFPAMRGKYVAQCEGDDYWCDTTKLQRQFDFMEANPEYSACVHNTTLSYCATDQQNRPLLRNTDGDCDVRIENVAKGVSYCFHTSSLFARRDIMCSIPPDFLDIGYKHGFSDHQVALWLMFCGKVRYMDSCMSVYRINSGASAWSSGVDFEYEKMLEYVHAEEELLNASLDYAPPEYHTAIKHEILEREFELMYLEGRDREQRKGVYRELLRKKPFSYRMKNLIKSYFPFIQRAHRKQKGYTK